MGAHFERGQGPEGSVTPYMDVWKNEWSCGAIPPLLIHLDSMNREYFLQIFTFQNKIAW